jgi:hypothetical protein
MPDRENVRDHEIDHILAGDPELIPSPRFTARVMSAVRSEAATPPPLPFPWAIVLPGPVLSIVAMVWCVVKSYPVNAGTKTPLPAALSQPLLTRLLADTVAVAQAAHVFAIDWLLLALFLAWVSWKLAVRIADVRS